MQVWYIHNPQRQDLTLKRCGLNFQVFKETVIKECGIPTDIPSYPTDKLLFRLLPAQNYQMYKLNEDTFAQLKVNFLLRFREFAAMACYVGWLPLQPKIWLDDEKEQKEEIKVRFDCPQREIIGHNFVYQVKQTLDDNWGPAVKNKIEANCDWFTCNISKFGGNKPSTLCFRVGATNEFCNEAQIKWSEPEFHEFVYANENEKSDKIVMLLAPPCSSKNEFYSHGPRKIFKYGGMWYLFVLFFHIPFRVFC